MTSIAKRRETEVADFMKSTEFKEAWDTRNELMRGYDLARQFIQGVSGGSCDTSQHSVDSGVALFERLFAYGFFGLLSDREQAPTSTLSPEEMISMASVIVDTGHPSATARAGRILELAVGRQSVDNDGGPITPRALATLAGVSERHVQNLMSSDDRFKPNPDGLVELNGIRDWLESRAAFRPSVWHLSTGAEAPHPATSIPQASDGTVFCPRLKRRGGFTIGPKGQEQQVDDFDEALRLLQQMDTPKWRRPNSKGNWGIVRLFRWKDIDPLELSVISFDHYKDERTEP